MTYRFSRALVRAIEQSPKSQVELGAPFNIYQSALSRYASGERFGDVVRERVEALGRSLGVNVPAVLSDLSEADEALVEEFAEWAILIDHAIGRADVINEVTDERLTFRAFAARHGRDAERWLALPIEARRWYASPIGRDRVRAGR